MPIAFRMATLFAVLLTAHSAAAAVDLSGVYVGDSGSRLGLSQSGSSLAGYFGPVGVSGSVSEDGHFTLRGGPLRCGPLTFGELQMSGVGDGYQIQGNYAQCSSGGSFLMSKCGNGLPDGEEVCDDDNRVNGDCCSATCSYDTAGTACTTDSNLCTNDLCDEAGTCLHIANTIVCDDGNECTTADRCSAATCSGSAVADGLACLSDQNICTDDVCSAGVCTHAANSVTCDDGIDCSSGDACSGGACTPTGVAPQCQGDLDVTGSWYFQLSTVEHELTQTGAVLGYDGPDPWTGSGAINPALRLLHIEASAGPCQESYDGVSNPQATRLALWHEQTCPNFGLRHWEDASRCPYGASPCCGNGIVEAGEICDDPYCCEADCQGWIANAPCSDPFVCRRSSHPQPAADLSALAMTDRFGSVTVKLSPANGLCAPAGWRDEQAPLRPQIYGLAYRASADALPAGPLTLAVWDRFGVRNITVRKLASVIVPSAAAAGEASVDAVDASERDVYACYSARLARGESRRSSFGLDYFDTFGEVPAYAKSISKFCVPADLNGGDPAATSGAGNLLCYKTTAIEKLDPLSVSVRDELSLPSVLRTSSAYDVCVPAITIAEKPAEGMAH